MHTIFMVHGMGNFKEGSKWSAELQKKIREHYDPKKYKFLGQTPFGKRYQFVEITYNQHFEKYLQEAQAQAERLSKWSKLVPNINGDVLKFLDRVVSGAGSTDSNKFAISHLGDVALYLATDVGEVVKNDIVVQITKALGDDFDPARDSWSVIAHSLGTRVMTEVLQAGFTAAPSMRSFGKARVVMMIANVSRLLQNLWPFNAGDVYHNAVFPSRGDLGVCKCYVNATHRLDPVAFVNEFDPPADFGDGRTMLDDVYHPVKLPAADITTKDIHAAEHYMEHPAVHTALFSGLIGAGIGPTDAEFAKAMDEYRKLTLEANITSVWRDSLAQLKTRPFGTVLQIVDLWEKYGDLLV
jgi:hypothetical protein